MEDRHKYESSEDEDAAGIIIFRRSFWSKRLNRRIYAKGKPFPIKVRQ